MARPPVHDDRPALRISIATWLREDKRGRAAMVRAADHMGQRLVILDLDGREWAPKALPDGW
jgi:hypothetical protein